MGKKIILIAASIFLIWQSVDLISVLSKLDNPGWSQSLFVSFLINLYLTGIFAFAGFALATQTLLPTSYYRIKHPRRLKKVYKSLKVSLFREFLLATFWRSKKQQGKFFDGTRKGIKNLETQAMKSEFGHLLPTITISFVAIYLFSIGLFILGIFTLLINIIGNVYPIILQRHHRMRIEILKKRQSSLQNN